MACQPVEADKSPARSVPVTLVPTVIAFAIGVFFASSIAASLPPTFLWLALAATFLAVCHTFRNQQQVLTFALIIPLFFMLGVIRATPFSKPPSAPQHIYNQIQTRSETSIIGILTQMPALPTGRSRIQIAAEQLIFPDGTITPTHGLVLLTMPGHLPANIEPGDRLIARAILKRPRSFLTPGVFDYGKYLAEKNIWITGWVRSPALLHKMYQPQKPAISERLHYLPERMRHRVGVFIEQTLDQQTSSLYRALLLGDRSAVDPIIIENFTATGCIHLLAISGTHMGLIALLTTFLAAWLLKRSTRLILYLPIWKTAALIALPPLAAYALLAGFQTPAVRALTMTTVFLVAILIDRQWSIPVNIAIAAFLLLAWKPVIIHTASFQLSFTAVLAITLLYPHVTTLFAPPSGLVQSTIHKLRRWLLAGLTVSTVATIGVLPLLLLHFNRLSSLSPISTLIIEPFLCLWALTIGLLACLLHPISPSLPSHLLHLGSLGLHSALFLSSSLASLPFASFRLPSPTPMEVTLYYIALIAFSQRHRFRFSQPIATVALISLLGTFFLNSTLASQDDTLRVSILDVGQGSATLLELPHHRAILIDGGSYLGERFDVGERIIAPFLWSRHIKKLEAVVISHPHADHYNGLPFIIRNFKPKTLWINGYPAPVPDYQDLLREAKNLGISVKTPQANLPLYADEGTKLSCIGSPPPPIQDEWSTRSEQPGADTNRHSMVLRLVYGQRSFLFPGDINMAAEERLVQEADGINADVLLAPHHGSRGSLSDSFIEAAAPDYIVVSAGTSRPSGMAEKAAVQKWRRTGATVFITAQNGAVSFTTDGAVLNATTTQQPNR